MLSADCIFDDEEDIETSRVLLDCIDLIERTG
jgi:hypothetical protein